MPFSLLIHLINQSDTCIKKERRHEKDEAWHISRIRQGVDQRQQDPIATQASLVMVENEAGAFC